MKKPVESTKSKTSKTAAPKASALRPNSGQSGKELRRRAEEIARKKAIKQTKSIEAMSPEEIRQTLHELQVHQIELDMQNDELRRAHTELEAVKERYFDLYDLAPVAYLTLSKKGLILEANLTAANLLGVARSALIKQPLSRFILNDDAGIYHLHLKKLLNTAVPQTWEIRMLKKDGTVFWARLAATVVQDAKGEPVCRVVMSDTTDHKKTEELLIASESRYRRLFESAQDGILILDAETGMIVDVNPFLIELLGYSYEKYIEKAIWEIGLFNDIADSKDKFLELQQKKYVRYEDLPLETADGRKVEVEFVSNVYLVNNQKVIQCNIRDITERKQAEAQKAILESQNRQLQKSESLGRMAAAIAHHFNNQLGVVIGNLELVMDKMPQDEEPFDTLNSALQSAWKAAQISGMMLTYVGQKSGQHEPLDISETCLQSLPILRAVMPGNVVMETDIPSPGSFVSANENQIQQVLTNLVTNAWESFGDKKGTISLNVKTVNPEEITAVHRYPGNWQPRDKVYACLEVKDRGCGIVKKDIEKVFDPFYSTKFTGRGMGLAVVMGIVKVHGGVITVESKQGVGSTFRVFFPISAEEIIRQPDKVAQSVAIAGSGIVLLVEDEEQLRNMAAAMLKRLGFSVIEAKDGVEAVDAFRQRQNEIHFVISDLTMPRMDGWETLTALRKLKPGIPVILASGYDKAHVMAGDHPELPQVFLGKPYKLKGLSDAIGQVLVGKKK